MAEKWPEGQMPPGGAWRAAVSAVAGIGWLIFLIVYLFFWAKYYTIYENIAIFLVSVLVLAAIMAPLWIGWGMKYAREAECEEKPKKAKSKKREE